MLGVLSVTVIDAVDLLVPSREMASQVYVALSCGPQTHTTRLSRAPMASWHQAFEITITDPDEELVCHSVWRTYNTRTAQIQIQIHRNGGSRKGGEGSGRGRCAAQCSRLRAGAAN